MPAEKTYPDAPFPVERLEVESAVLNASAHKNEFRPLHLDWDFFVKFKPLEVGGEEHQTALHIEIETTDIRKLEDFQGYSRRDTERDFNIGSFYLFDHRPSVDTTFRINAVNGKDLKIETQLLVDVGDSYSDPNPPLRRVQVRTQVAFEGILVSSYGVQCAANEDALMKIANELFDFAEFRSPRKTEDRVGRKKELRLWFEPL